MDIFVIVMLTIITEIVSVIMLVFVIPMKVAKKLATKKVQKENMSEVDFSKEKDFYRDILKGYSPAELRYIDDFCINEKREIVATLLSLKLKKKIEIETNQIIILDLNENGLKLTEKFILRSIRDGIGKRRISKTIKNLIENEAIEDGLIVKNRKPYINKNIIKIMAVWIIIQISLWVPIRDSCFGGVDANVIGNLVLVVILIIPMVILSLSSRYIENYVIIKGNSYKRTEKGEKLNKKIEGLKKYIKEYSLLSRRNQEELTLWEEYLIYSVIFDLNTTIVEDINSLIE